MWNGDIRFNSTNRCFGENERVVDFSRQPVLVAPVKPGKLAFGIGVSTPFGMASKYPKDMDPSACATRSPYESACWPWTSPPRSPSKSPTLLSVAAGLDIIYSKLSIKRAYPWGALPGLAGTPDGELSCRVMAGGLALYMGVNWEIFKGHRLAVVGRLPVTINYEWRVQGPGHAGGHAGASDQCPRCHSDQPFRF
jgi:hypothetical protein